MPNRVSKTTTLRIYKSHVLFVSLSYSYRVIVLQRRLCELILQYLIYSSSNSIDLAPCPKGQTVACGQSIRDSNQLQ